MHGMRVKYHTTHHNRFMVRDHPGDPVPAENFWILWCKGRLTETDTQTIWLGATPSGLTSAHLHHPPIFLQAGCPSCHPTNSVKALKATSAFRLGRRRLSSPQWCYLHHLRTINESQVAIVKFQDPILLRKCEDKYFVFDTHTAPSKYQLT